MRRSKNAPVIGVLLAAGEGARYGAKKQFIDFDGTPLLMHSLETMRACSGIEYIFPVLPDSVPEPITRLIQPRPTGKLREIVEGGKTRFDSISRALAKLDDCEYADESCVLIHDAARPLTDSALFEKCISALQDYEAVTTVIASANSIGRGEGGCIREILPRSEHFQIQTPQGAKLGLLREAYAAFPAHTKIPNDDCEVILACKPDIDIGMVEGDVRNIKLTQPEDLPLLKCLARQQR